MADMIDHHAMAVEMAEVRLQTAVHPELRTLCQRITDAQFLGIQRNPSLAVELVRCPLLATDNLA